MANPDSDQARPLAGGTEGAPVEQRAADAPAVKPPSAIEVEIDKWIVEHFHGTIVSRDTEVYNHVLKAAADLKLRLASL